MNVRVHSAALRLVPVLAITVAAVLAPAPARADSSQSRAWELCFTVGLYSCSIFHLFTQPLYWEDTDVRVGTEVEVRVRQQNAGAFVSALYSVVFGYWSPLDPQEATGDGVTSGMSVTPEALGNAASPDSPDGWGVDASSFQGVPEWTYLHLNNVFLSPGDDGYIRTQAIAGCGLGPAGNLDAFFATYLQTCEDGDEYRFLFQTDAFFNASLFRSIQVDHFGRLAGDEELQAWTCTAYLDGSESFGIDLQTGDYGDFCWASALQPGGGGDPIVVPEPAAMTLLLTGLAGVAGVARRRRRADARQSA